MEQHLDNHALIQLILAGDPEGSTQLYLKYRRSLSLLARRYCPDQADDCVHDTILAALKQIKDGKLENAGALPGYLNIILRRVIIVKNSQISRRCGDEELFKLQLDVKADPRPSPERQLLLKERARMMQETLRSLKTRDQELLRRFYLEEESADSICAVMSLSGNQFRVFKSRAKKRLEDVVRQVLQEESRQRKTPLRTAKPGHAVPSSRWGEFVGVGASV